MFSPKTIPNLTGDVFEDMPQRQKEACALWFYGDRHGPMSELQIAERLGISQQAVHKLIGKGTAFLRAKGCDPVRAIARAPSLAK